MKTHLPTNAPAHSTHIAGRPASPGQFSLRMLAALLAGSGFTGVALAEDRKPEAEAVKPGQTRVQVIGEKGGKGEGLVVQFGEAPGMWLGLMLEAENGGLQVEQVVPGSPAAKAGIKTGDVVLASGDTALKSVAEVQKLVQAAGGKSVALKVRRAGQEIVIEVKPEPRKETANIVIGEGGEFKKGGKGELQFQFRQPEGQPRKNPEGVKNPTASGWQVMGSPYVAPNAQIPGDLEITLKKKGNSPTKIKVKQGAQMWSVTENEIEKLPESIRGHVARMLPGHRPTTTWTTGAILNAAPSVWGVPGQSLPGGLVPRKNPPGIAPGQPNVLQPDIKPISPANGAETKELQQLKHQLHELQEQIEGQRKK